MLIVFNHPLWDLYRVGKEKHDVLVNEFLAVNGQFLHALELNGLRDWKENRETSTLAGKWNQLVISGGDRHGIEPNANVNLTRAKSFNEFVHEVRRERESHVLFMPQYAEPWKHRILQSTLAAIRNYPDFPEGSRFWDERVFHPDAEGEIQPLKRLWMIWAGTDVLRGNGGGGADDGSGAGLERAADGVERCRRDEGGVGARVEDGDLAIR